MTSLGPFHLWHSPNIARPRTFVELSWTHLVLGLHPLLVIVIIFIQHHIQISILDVASLQLIKSNNHKEHMLSQDLIKKEKIWGTFW